MSVGLSDFVALHSAVPSTSNLGLYTIVVQYDLVERVVPNWKSGSGT